VSAEWKNSDQERVVEIVIDRPFFLQYWMLIIYALIIAVAIYMWKQGIDHIRQLWKRKKAILGELVRQREEIKAASDELRQPMSRMTSIIMNLAEKDASLEEREQLNALHSQMLQLITRVSDMQTALDHPEQKAEKTVRRSYLMEGQGEMNLPALTDDELTSEIKPIEGESPTAKYRIVFIDNNKEFVKFVTSRLKYLYDFHPYDNIHKAATDIESMIPDIVVCKQDMDDMTGSELCKNIKLHPRLNRIKFVLMTDTRLSAKDMLDQGIAMSADDYLSKPFNLQEVIMRFNKLLGVGPIEIDNRLIAGAETRMLEDRNSSMTTASESNTTALTGSKYTVVEDEQINAVTIVPVKSNLTKAMDQSVNFAEEEEMREKYSMADNIDKQLIDSIEQYVQQNMSRGTINLEEMAQAMGMAMKPFFQKVREITGKTPAEVVRDIRLRHACILLQRTDLNMSVLANNVGFATGEHFIALFKERFGMSPSEYRLKYRK
jgi:AraC-like DNA-binding protein/DNA-binding response OmpR family regulator